MLTLDKIYHAAFVLKDVARKTDLIEAPKLSKDCQLYLKTENLQVTGSFKVRGAYYKISQLSKEESDKGVIACSAGNHAQGVALAATRRGIRSIVCMPDAQAVEAARRQLLHPAPEELLFRRAAGFLLGHSKNSGTKNARNHVERCAGTISHEVRRDALVAFMTD